MAHTLNVHTERLSSGGVVHLSIKQPRHLYEKNKQSATKRRRLQDVSWLQSSAAGAACMWAARVSPLKLLSTELWRYLKGKTKTMKTDKKQKTAFIVFTVRSARTCLVCGNTQKMHLRNIIRPYHVSPGDKRSTDTHFLII